MKEVCWYVSSNSLNTIRDSRDSQWRSHNSGADGCHLSDLNTIHTALFCSDWTGLWDFCDLWMWCHTTWNLHGQVETKPANRRVCGSFPWWYTDGSCRCFAVDSYQMQQCVSHVLTLINIIWSKITPRFLMATDWEMILPQILMRMSLRWLRLCWDKARKNSMFLPFSFNLYLIIHSLILLIQEDSLSKAKRMSCSDLALNGKYYCTSSAYMW